MIPGIMKQHNFRLDGRTDELLSRLAEHMALSEADVVRQAIRQLGKRELPRWQSSRHDPDRPPEPMQQEMPGEPARN